MALASTSLALVLLLAASATTPAASTPNLLLSTTTFTIGFTPTVCNLNQGALTSLAVMLNTGTSIGAGLAYDAATNTFTVSPSVSHFTISGSVYMQTYPGSNGVGIGSGTNTFEVVDTTSLSVLATLASVSGTWQQLLSSSSHTVPAARDPRPASSSRPATRSASFSSPRSATG